MKQNCKIYEAPKMKIYRFDDNDLILTASGGIMDKKPDYAARALNDFFGGINTTKE